MKKIGIVLSGGGARGFAHLGILKALAEEGIKVDGISGCSAGAIVGAMIATGYAPEAIMEIILSNVSYRTFRPAFSKFGILKIENLENIYSKFLKDNSFESLAIPLTINATDIYAGEIVYFNSGELIKPILASTCIPGLFEPLHYQGRVLIDGGVLNNMPIEPLEGKYDFIIGSHCNPYGIKEGSPLVIKSVIQKSLFLAINSNTKIRAKRCDLVIEPPELKNYEPFSINKSREMFKIAYEYTKSLEVGEKVLRFWGRRWIMKIEMLF